MSSQEAATPGYSKQLVGPELLYCRQNYRVQICFQSGLAFPKARLT
jgi:hypothetical protein